MSFIFGDSTLSDHTVLFLLLDVFLYFNKGPGIIIFHWCCRCHIQTILWLDVRVRVWKMLHLIQWYPLVSECRAVVEEMWPFDCEGDPDSAFDKQSADPFPS